MGEKGRDSDAFQWAYERYIGKDPERVASFNSELAKLEVAQRIYDIRTKLGMTKEQLAEIAGLNLSTIDQLEEAGYGMPLDEPIKLINNAFEEWIKTVIIPAARMKPEDYSIRVSG